MLFVGSNLFGILALTGDGGQALLIAYIMRLPLRLLFRAPIANSVTGVRRLGKAIGQVKQILWDSDSA